MNTKTTKWTFSPEKDAMEGGNTGYEDELVTRMRRRLEKIDSEVQRMKKVYCTLRDRV